MRYAKNTNVSVEKSKGEMEWLLKRFGATQFGYMTSPTKSQIGFIIKGRRIEFTLIMPDPKTFERSPTGRSRDKNTILKLWEQECRTSWRELLLLVKAKLVAIEKGITSLDDEFLAYIALPGGSTIGKEFGNQIQQMIESKKVPLLMES